MNIMQINTWIPLNYFRFMLIFIIIFILACTGCDKETSDDSTNNGTINNSNYTANNQNTNSNNNDNNNDNLNTFGFMTSEQWASSENINISINKYDTESIFLTNTDNAYKPSWNIDETKITFFKFHKGNMAIFNTWQTKLCVINADGTGFQELTDGTYKDWNPTWTRDGTNRIINNRFSMVNNIAKNEIYFVSLSGELHKVSDPDYQYFEWAFSGLKDGRLVIDKCNLGAESGHSCKTYLLTPQEGKKGTYEELTRPTNKLWHKLSVSPDETKVTYMLDEGSVISTYEDCTIYIADFDKTTLTISNQKAISELNLYYIDEYPRWTKDSKMVVYDSNRSGKFQMYAYRLSDGVTRRISPDPEKDYRFISFKGVPK